MDEDDNDGQARKISTNNQRGKVVRALLAPNTSIGQHFLKNPAVVDRYCMVMLLLTLLTCLVL